MLLLLSAARGVLYAYYVWVAFGYYLVRFGALKGPLSWLAIVIQFPIDMLGMAVPFFRTSFLSYSPVLSRGPLAMHGRGWLLPDFPATSLIGEIPAHLVAGAITYAIVYSAPTFLRNVTMRRVALTVVLLLGLNLAVFGLARAPRWAGAAVARYEAATGHVVLYSNGDPTAYPSYSGELLYSEMLRLQTGIEQRYYAGGGQYWDGLTRWRMSYYEGFGAIMRQAIDTQIGDKAFRAATRTASRLFQCWRERHPNSPAWRRTP